MSEHQFKNIYWLGYGDALAESRRKGWTATLFILFALMIVAVLAFWAGRASMQSKVASAYEAGFEAGTAEGSTNWEEWR